MKTALRLFARLPNNRGGRGALTQLRAGINKTDYKLRVLYSGPREGAFYCRKDQATGFRLYLTRKGENRWAAAQAERERDHALRMEHTARTAADALGRDRDAWHRRSLTTQAELNRIPGWVLWCVGWWRARGL